MADHDTPEPGAPAPGTEPTPEPAPVPMPDQIVIGDEQPAHAPSSLETGTPRPVATGPEPGGLSTGWKVVIALVVLAALTAIGVGWWLYYETTQARNAAIERLNEATALVESADDVVLAVDAVVRAEIDADVGEQAAELQDELPGAREELSSAIRLIGQARVDLPDDELVYAQALEDSALARIDMLDDASTILEYNVKAAAALDPALDAWSLVVEAGDLSIQAVESYNELTRESVTRSAELTGEAAEKVREAQALFSEAATGFPEVDFEPYLEYCAEKLAALEISKEANEAYLADRPEAANELSQRYNEAEQALAELAAELPASPAELIANGYERYAAEATEDYFDARARATDADGRLREAAGEGDVGIDEEDGPPPDDEAPVDEED